MPTTAFTALTCPLDGAPLVREGSSWRCASGHCYDVASQGYTNLLPVQHKRSLDPGDSKEMVAARRRFLNAGHYAPIAAAVNAAVLANLPASGRFACLDAGCGEGYYLRQLAAAPGERELAILGLDISKWAVQAAARQDQRPNWVVGSNAKLPVADASFERILCLFGFPVYGEFARVLQAGGELIQVDAGPEHLRELREVIYPSLKPERSGEMPAPPGFTLLASETVRFPLTIHGAEQIADLLAMTPHLYRATPEGRARAAALTEIALTVDVKIVRWGKAEN